MTKDLPSNCLMIVLQHNHLRTELFGTVLNTSKDNPQISNMKVTQLQFIASSSKLKFISFLVFCLMFSFLF